jgi:hypothetical protein
VELPLIFAGSLAVVSAAIHWIGGEALIKRVSPEMLPPEGSGGRRQAKMEIHINWQVRPPPRRPRRPHSSGGAGLVGSCVTVTT